MTRQQPVSDEPLITMAETAARLGVPLKTFRRWRDHRQAPLGFRMGGRIYFRWSEVASWRDQQREPQPVTSRVRRAS